MKKLTFAITGATIILSNLSYAETWQGGWRDCARGQIHRADMRQYRSIDFWNHGKPKARHSFELSDANLVFNNVQEYANCGFVIYDNSTHMAILASRFLIRKNEDPKIKGKFKVTLFDIKYRDDKAVEECDEVIRKIEDAAQRQCAELFMGLVKRGIARDKEREVQLKELAKAAEEAKAKAAAEVKEQSDKSKENLKTPASSISTAF